MCAANMPAVRFEGFEEAWEELRFDSIATRMSETCDDPALPCVEYEDIDSDIGCLNKDLTCKSSFKPGILFKPDDVLYGKLRPYLRNWLNPAFTGVAVGDFWVLRSNYGSGSFLFRLVQSERFNHLSNMSSGSKMPRADWNLVSASKFPVPTLAEQEKIGALFERLDSLIESRTSELERLKESKAALLSKMFPREGEVEPEIRFAGFEGAWKRCAIGNFCEMSKGHGYSKADCVREGAPAILYGSLYTDYSILITEVATSVHPHGGDALSRVGDVIVPASGETPEEIARASAIMIPGIILGGDLNIIHSGESIDPVYLALAITYGEGHRGIVVRAQGATISHIHPEDIAEVSISYPSLAEQQKIGEFFQRFDDLVADREQEIECLKRAKQALLQAMFA